MAMLLKDTGEVHLLKTEVDELVGEKIWDRSRAVLALVSLLLELGHLASTLAMLTSDISLCTLALSMNLVGLRCSSKL